MNERYISHMSLAQIGKEGQEKLSKSKILCVGCGGLASSVLPYMVASGIGEITIVDFDIISLNNLNRQILFNEQDVGKFKVDVAIDRLKQQNSHVKLNAKQLRFDINTGRELIKEYDLILDCTDDYQTKVLINYLTIQMNKPWIYASVLGFDGQVIFFSRENNKMPCYKCLQKKPLLKSLRCGFSGVLGASVNMIGSLQATLAIQALLGQKHNANYLFVFDLWQIKQQKFLLTTQCDCNFHDERIQINI